MHHPARPLRCCRLNVKTWETTTTRVSKVELKYKLKRFLNFPESCIQILRFALIIHSCKPPRDRKLGQENKRKKFWKFKGIRSSLLPNKRPRSSNFCISLFEIITIGVGKFVQNTCARMSNRGNTCIMYVDLFEKHENLCLLIDVPAASYLPE